MIVALKHANFKNFTILVLITLILVRYHDNINYRDDYSHDISWHEILVIAHPYAVNA